MESEPKYHTLVESANDAIFIVKENFFIDCNTKTLEIFGLNKAKSIIGKAPYEFSPARQPDGRLSKEKAIGSNGCRPPRELLSFLNGNT